MNTILDRLDHTNLPVKERDEIAAKQKRLKPAQFDPRLNRIYYTDLSELPDEVKNYPPLAQSAFLVTFNNWLAKCADVGKSMRAAWKALRRKVEHIEARKRKRRAEFDETRLRWETERIVKGPRTIIVVPG